MKNRHRIYGYTLGCRLNAYETEALLEEFRLRCDMERVSDPAEATIILVNTCAVTGRSTARSRKTVRSFLRNTDAEVVVTGCVAEVTPWEFADQDIILLPNTAKSDLVNTIAGKLEIPISALPGRSKSPNAIFPAFAPEVMDRTRAFLKVQDGCDNHCTYCIVPAARGPSRSQPRELVLSQAGKLAAAGFREILLTGVDLVRYGNDLYGADDYGLIHLVRDLLEKGGFRIRLSSMEPIGLSTEMLEGIAYPGVCRHLHIPVQSGSDRILEKMGRMYSGDDIKELFDRSMELFPGIGIGADVIAGFPGETEDDFRKTVELISHPAVAYLHVFPFSARPGTPAALMYEDMIHTETITNRAKYLRSLSAKLRNRFRRSQIGTDALVLVESRIHKGSSRLIGMTDNYIPVVSPPGSREGEMVEMTLTESDICWDKR